MTRLPIDDALPALLDALAAAPNAVLEAPPGAGKTTRVPLALLDAQWLSGRILMLEPRRLAARAAAQRMAETLGEEVGQTVGFRIRGETAISSATRIEVLTEGVLTRMLNSDPGLEGVSCVIFDEAHERSLNGDLGLAFCLESQEALRPDLRLLVMSATLDAAPFARLMGGAARISSEGRAFPVETLWRDAPPPARARLETTITQTIREALSRDGGDLLAFLPGVGEIARAQGLLNGIDAEILPLHGALPLSAQRAAVRAGKRRRVVLATAIAETSLTVEGVRIVVDSGLARRARFDPGSGMSRLVTERASRAESDQRRGRAGRVAPGVCWRLWTKGAEGAAPEFAPPEMLTADLTGLALDLGLWGAREAGDLRFLDPPPQAALAEARALLRDLGALDAAGAPTARGRRMAALPAHPRLARMILDAGDDAPTACALAALLSERDPLRGDCDLARRLRALRDPAAAPPETRGALERARQTARRLGPSGRIDPDAAGRLVALAFPDRLAQRRKGGAPRFLLSGGKGAKLAPGDPLAAQPMLAVAETDGDPREALIRLAAPLAASEAEALFADRIETVRRVDWSARTGAVEAREERRLGALTLESRRIDAAPEEIAAALCDGLRARGLGALGWSDAATRFLARARFAAARGAIGGDWSDAALTGALEDWLAPFLSGLSTLADLGRLDPLEALKARLGWDGARALERAAPATLTTPAGSARPIDYSGDAPRVEARAQEFYGLDTHPTAAGEPVLLALLSPAGRPIALTSDLPGFWRAGWLDARRDMRARYVRHDWPEKPWEAAPGGRKR